MAFLDKITQAGQATVQKAMEKADIVRFNSLVTEEEKKLSSKYYEVGKLYISLHPDDFEEKFANLIQEIRESENKVVEYKQQILNLKGVVICEKCGAEVPVGSTFCGLCGYPMQKQAPVDVANLIPCVGCGAMVDKTGKFCTSCGKPVAESLTE